MILGVGIQWIDVGRFERALGRHGTRLRERVFTEGEVGYAGRRSAQGELQSLAVRFAAKCAARAALSSAAGTALPPLRFREFEVVRESGRAPTLDFHGDTKGHAERSGVERVALSLTHDREACMAHVLVEGVGR